MSGVMPSGSPAANVEQLETIEEIEVIDDELNKNNRPMGKTLIIVRRFMRNIPAVVGVGIIILVALVSILGNILSPYNVGDADLAAIGQAPSAEHWLGTDQAGGDVFTQLTHGTVTSLIVGLVVGILTPLIAAIYGCAMAYIGGWVDKVMLFILETMIMAPAFLLIAILMSGKTAGVPILILMLVVFGWMGTARLIRGLTLSLVDREYVKAARYMGVNPITIIVRHLMPNIASLTILNITFGIWGAILNEVAYSYIGIGVKVPDVSLGTMLSNASEALDSYPWMFWAPVVMLLLITGPLALINDGLRDAFDPNSKSGGKAK